ncbi:hypothetical protein C8J57DRAFT_1530482 [Mycena rebaudengoi]|nr:hypothetical protein C8J57DRAFT_1530482 [Mycena rebaudengoi]
MAISAGPFLLCHQIPLFNMHVAGCIVFLALSLPVFAVPVLNGPNVGARTTKSTRTAHATLSTKLATKSPAAKPTTLRTHVTASATLATKTADHRTRTTTTSKRTTAAQTVKTNSSAKISMTPPKSSVKPSATSSPKPSAVISSGSVRPIIQQRHTDSQAFGLGANTHSCPPVDEVHFVFGPPEEFFDISELAWRGRYILGPTYELVHKNDYYAVPSQSARPSISTVAVSHGSTVSAALHSSSSPTHTLASSGDSLFVSASGHSTAPASWDNLRPPAGPSASSARVSHGSAALVSSTPSSSASGPHSAGSSVAPSASGSVVASGGTSISSFTSASAHRATCGPVPTNTIPNFPDALPNQYIVSLKPNANVTQHLANVQAALAADNSVLFQDTVIGIIYRGNFSDRDVAFIQTTSEFQSITRDRVAVESRKRAVGTTWNLARLAQADKLQPGQPGQGTSDTASDWSVGLKDGLGQDIYVVDTGVDGNHPLLTPRVEIGIAVADREPVRRKKTCTRRGRGDDAAGRGGLRRDAAKYMVNFAVAMVLDAAIRSGMRRINVRDAACSRCEAALTTLDAALTTLDAALTTLDAALKILEAAALRHHPAEGGTYSQMKHIIIIIIFYPARSLALMVSLNAN